MKTIPLKELAIQLAREEGIREGRLIGEKQGIEIGLKIGEKQGIEKGKEKVMLRIARKMLAGGQPVEKIMEYTGLSKETILSLG
jgi:predicted transposase/invertase (TIGR01784 family)